MRSRVRLHTVRRLHGDTVTGLERLDISSDPCDHTRDVRAEIIFIQAAEGEKHVAEADTPHPGLNLDLRWAQLVVVGGVLSELQGLELPAGLDGQRKGRPRQPVLGNSLRHYGRCEVPVGVDVVH